MHLTLPDGVVRATMFNRDYGCVTLPTGAVDVFFDPADILSELPAPRSATRIVCMSMPGASTRSTERQAGRRLEGGGDRLLGLS